MTNPLSFYKKMNYRIDIFRGFENFYHFYSKYITNPLSFCKKMNYARQYFLSKHPIFSEATVNMAI